MGESDKRKVGERGQVTLPKKLREQLGIHGGDEVVVRREEERIVIEKPVTREDLAEGYRRRADQNRELADDMQGTSREANEHLGDAPDW